jgi:hypothetical protein
MISPSFLTTSLDLESLHAAIQDEYACVALEPERGFHFHTGRPLARLLGYADEWLVGIPEAAIESFAGTGSPFSLGPLRPGERAGGRRWQRGWGRQPYCCQDGRGAGASDWGGYDPRHAAQGQECRRGSEGDQRPQDYRPPALPAPTKLSIASM